MQGPHHADAHVRRVPYVVESSNVNMVPDLSDVSGIWESWMDMDVIDCNDIELHTCLTAPSVTKTPECSHPARYGVDISTSELVVSAHSSPPSK